MDRATEFAQAIYGGSIPASQLQTASIDVMKSAMRIKSDLKVSFHDLTDDEAYHATLTVLTNMRATRGITPRTL